jgi:hypothetical protein
MDYKVPARAYIKKSIKEGRNPLLPNYMGHIGRKPVYEADGPLEYMDDILARTERGVREVTTEEWAKLKGYPLSWGTTAKDRRRIIQDPSLHFWSVLGDAFAPTLIQPEPKVEPNEEYDGIYTGPPPLSPRSPREEDSSDEKSEVEVDYPSPEHWNSPITRTLHLSGTLLIYKREESGLKHVYTNSESLLKHGLTKGWL